MSSDTAEFAAGLICGRIKRRAWGAHGVGARIQETRDGYVVDALTEVIFQNPEAVLTNGFVAIGDFVVTSSAL